MSPGLLRDILTVTLGVATGALSGLVGVGGAVISTPGIRALGASAQLAIGTTLPSIIPGAAAGTARYWKSGLIDWRTVASTAPFGIVAAVGGSLLSKVVPGNGHLLMLATAGLLGVSAWRMRAPKPATSIAGGAETDAELISATSGPSTATEQPAVAAPLGRYAAVGLVAGLLSGLLGIGGGIVMVPGFTQFAGMSVKQAVATSLACVGLFAVPGTITHALLGDIDWRFALLLTVGVIPGARLGAAMAMRVDNRRLGSFVAVFLGFTAVVYAAGEIAALVG